MTKAEQKRIGRERRHNRIRTKINGAEGKPRLSVYKSNRYLHAQIIDDQKGVTLAAGTTKEFTKKSAGGGSASGGKMDAAVWLGSELANRAKEKHIEQIVFDRGGFRYTGRIAALAEAARKGGLKF